jgi:hypothetical protein
LLLKLSANVDSVNLLAENVNIARKIKEVLLYASKEAGIEVNTDIIKIIHYINIVSKYFENVEKVKIFGNDIKKWEMHSRENKSILNSLNSFYHAVHNLLSFCLLSKNVKIKIYKTIILPFVLYG